MRDNHKLDTMDVCDHAIAIEAMYGVQVLFELQPVKENKKYKWRVLAKARRTEGDMLQELVTPRPCLYPSPDHRDLSGAMYRAAFDLELALQAQWVLQQLPSPVDDV